jgi:N-acyl-D-amino-acid deacylase
MSYDLIIKNGEIVDGAGNPWFYGDIGITDGMIEKIRPKLDISAAKEIDAKGLIVCPGFIDMHTHTDFLLAIYTKMDSAMRQGITTSVVGMCGESLAPIPPEKLDEFKKLFSSLTPMGGDLKITWNTYKEYLEELDKLRIPGNIVPVVGFAPIRIAGGPGYENRPPTPQEIEKMQSYVKEAMEAGAFGLSTGLIYAPQVFAKTEEIIELAKVVGEYNGLYFSHIRGEGKNLIKAVNEVIEIVEKSGCAGGQIAHHKVAGKAYWGASKETIRLMEEANSRGISITCDQYPYNRGQSGLVTSLPPWAREGGKEKILERLNNPEDRERIKKDILNPSDEWENWIETSGFDHIYITFFKNKEWKDVEGRSISEITKIKGKSNDFETYFEILINENADVNITIETMGEEDIRRIMTSRYQMIGTDATASPHLPDFKIFHPRTFGTYPRLLGKYVREEKLLTMEDAIRKMTSFPAQRLGLRDRGLIRENNWADIVIVNPDTIKDNTDFMRPHQFPEGVIHVIINGVIVVENEKQRKKYPGKILRRPN